MNTNRGGVVGVDFRVGDVVEEPNPDGGGTVVADVETG